jgi:hypothetical protein
MVSSLPQRQDHLRIRYRALLESAWGRPGTESPHQPSSEPTRSVDLAIAPSRPNPGGVARDPQPERVPV